MSFQNFKVELVLNILKFERSPLYHPFILYIPPNLAARTLIVTFCFRQICVDDGQELSLQYSCQFYEVSAAENFAGVSLAFQSLLREARSVQLLKALPIRRKLGVNSVSKVLGNIFGKNSKGDRKKRPSLSI